MQGNDYWNERYNVDYKNIKISDLLKKEKDKIVYEYDFGDSWEHDVILEKILPFDEKLSYPVCIKGKMHCPPEDVGGISGYEQMLEILKQQEHEEYESYIDWLGDGFDPVEFELEEVNLLLLMKNFGCMDLDV